MKDFYLGQLYNRDDYNAFAIEPEISAEFYNNSIEKIYDDYKNESDNIIELLNLHYASSIKKRDVYEKIKEYYSERFPIGYNPYLSGGVHFVLFGNYGEYENRANELKYKLLNCPLYCKIYNNTLYSRELNNRCSFNIGSYLKTDTKGYAVSLKQELYSSGEMVEEGIPIEFRCNNVFDERIFGYYQGILLCVKNNIKFKKLEGARNYCMDGDTQKYNNEESMDIHISNTNGYTLKQEELSILRHNIKIILKTLVDNNLVESAKQLKEYLNERGIKYI